MTSAFYTVLNMSITASWLVLAVILLRFALKKAPKWIMGVLWGFVALRLMCPFSVESILSLIPSAQTVPVSGNSFADAPRIDSGFAAVDSTMNRVLLSGSLPLAESEVSPVQIANFVIPIVWLVGIFGMLMYTLISYLRIWRKVREAVPHEGNVWLCDRIATPFILGICKPRIYLPASMNETDIGYVLSHERAHLKRKDYFWKPLGFLLLSVYWFNPILWAAYILLCRDIELACDEKVIRECGAEIKKPYSDALISCSVPRKMISACPLAFGEVGVKERVKGVLNYKKPAFWVIIVAVLACIVTAVCLLTNPKSKTDVPTPNPPQRFEIIDRAEKENLPVDAMLEKFYSDENYDYCFYGIKNQYVLVKFADGAEKTVKDALKDGDITIADLDSFGIRYTKQEKGKSLLPGANPYFNAEVLEIGKDAVLVRPDKNSNIFKSADRIWVPLKVNSKNPVPPMKVGDTVRVVYSGLIAAIYPAKIETVFAIYAVDKDGNVISVEPKSEPTTEKPTEKPTQKPTEKSTKVTPVNKENIAFELKGRAYLSVSDTEPMSGGVIIRSYSELKKSYVKTEGYTLCYEDGTGKEYNHYAEAFDEKFFKDKALIMTYDLSTGSLYKAEPINIKTVGREVTVAFQRIKPPLAAIGTNEVNFLRYLIAVDKADLAGVETVKTLKT